MDESTTDPPVRRKLNLKPRDENAAQKGCRMQRRHGWPGRAATRLAPPCHVRPCWHTAPERQSRAF
ncbi:hypothetical protein HaLaN_14735 [Haematococcus lacustris]|uniref:Uncharacterized protein n=1 Tax=Haematococcus lacustris TaxID=44745 RepID=A0A699ZQ30_HAELA|nr:hypothetical protein HaLaN_14735 [Haematococcus lacustris]